MRSMHLALNFIRFYWKMEIFFEYFARRSISFARVLFAQFLKQVTEI